MKIFNVVFLLIIALSFFACSDDDSSSPPPDNYYIIGKEWYSDDVNFIVYDPFVGESIRFKYSDSTKATDDPSAYSPTLPICNKDREGWIALIYREDTFNYDDSTFICCKPNNYMWIISNFNVDIHENNCPSLEKRSK